MNPELEVPTIDERDRIPERVIQAMARLIAEKFKPQKIILFGSYARGNPRPESDVDLMVIMETNLKETDQAIQISHRIEHRFGLDLIVYTPRRLKERIQLGDWFLREVLTEGKILYESADN